MATVRLSPIFNGWQGFGNTGLTLNGGKIFTFHAGTTTPFSTYTTSAGNVFNANPTVLDSAGRPPQEIWLVEGQSYKFVVTDSLNNTLATYDNIVGIGDFLAGTPSVTFGGIVTFGGSVVMGAGLSFTGVGQYRIKGDFSNATIANRLCFETNVANGNTDLVLLPDGTSTQTSINFFNNTDPTNCGFGHIGFSGEFAIQSTRVGAGVTQPITFSCGNAGAPETMRLNTSQQLLIGTVTAGISGAQLRVAGLVQLDNAVAFSVHRNGVAQNINNTTFTQVLFPNEDFDQNNSFDIVLSRFQPPAGKYLLTASTGYAVGIDQQRFVVLIYKNGVAFKAANFAASGGSSINAQVNAVVDANGLDFFEVYAWQNSGGLESISGTSTDTFFMGHRIG